eukprot:6182011-Pleurochrysis_carterae.AAC.2
MPTYRSSVALRPVTQRSMSRLSCPACQSPRSHLPHFVSIALQRVAPTQFEDCSAPAPANDPRMQSRPCRMTQSPTCCSGIPNRTFAVELKHADAHALAEAKDFDRAPLTKSLPNALLLTFMSTPCLEAALSLFAGRRTSGTAPTCSSRINSAPHTARARAH